MASRAVGASFALVAALLLATSLAGALAPSHAPAWWDGHPHVGQKTFEHKAVHVGLVGARGCNLGETVTCDSLDMGGLVFAIGIVELLAMLGLAAAVVALGLAIWHDDRRRSQLGRAAIALAIAGVLLAVLRIALGPDIHAGKIEVGVPIGFGLFVFLGGAVASALAGVAARAGASRPRASVPSFAPAPGLDASRISAPILPTPRSGFESPVDALAPTQPAPPMFDRPGGNGGLRPLYDLNNAGVVPTPPPPKFPARAPTPIPRSSFVETGEAPTRHATPPPAAPPPAAPSPRPIKPSAPPPLPSPRRDLEAATAVEIDAEAKARHLAEQAAQQATERAPARAPDGGDPTDQVELPSARHPASKPPPISVPRSIPPRPLMVPVATPPPPRDRSPSAPPPSAPRDRSPSAPPPSAALPSAPISTAPASLPPPAESALHAAGPMPACPQCDAPMAWVEEHLRFFCKQCRMYF